MSNLTERKNLLEEGTIFDGETDIDKIKDPLKELEMEEIEKKKELDELEKQFEKELEEGGKEGKRKFLKLLKDRISKLEEFNEILVENEFPRMKNINKNFDEKIHNIEYGNMFMKKTTCYLLFIFIFIIMFLSFAIGTKNASVGIMNYKNIEYTNSNVGELYKRDIKNQKEIIELKRVINRLNGEKEQMKNDVISNFESISQEIDSIKKDKADFSNFRNKLIEALNY